MYSGVVKFFQKEKNYGFITPDEGGTDFFFHGSKVIGSVATDDLVTFDVAEGKKGPEGINVKKQESVDVDEDSEELD